MIEEKINTILTFFREVGNIAFTRGKYVVAEQFRERLDFLAIPYEEVGELLELRLKTFFTGVPVKYYEALESELKSEDILGDFLVISGAAFAFQYVSGNLQLVEYGNPKREKKKLLEDLIGYFTIFNHFKSDKFCDYFNDGNTEIVVYSSINGIIKIKYTAIPAINGLEDVSSKANQIIPISSSLEVGPFFKNAIYATSNGTGIVHLNEVIQRSEDIISITRRDYELVSKKFDFEKFRDSVLKEKEKYFTSIREVVSKIFGQAVGIPISISASVFATYKVSDDSVMLVLVMLAFILYVVFYVRLQWVYGKDVDEIKQDFESSFEIIKQKSGLSESLIQKEREKIRKRIFSTKTTIYWLIGIICLLSFLVVLYMVYQITKTETFYFLKLIFG